MSTAGDFRILIMSGDEHIATLDGPLAKQTVELAIREYVMKALVHALYRQEELAEDVSEAGATHGKYLQGQ